MPDMRVAFDSLFAELEGLFAALGFAPARARLAARLFAEASLDGVPSHGLNRVPRFVRQVKAGIVNPAAEAEALERFGGWERWHGRRGAGNLNAWACTGRAVELAREHGIGCVGLGETNHWMRGGAYGWQAASAGCALLAWTNTLPNMAPWGAEQAAVGNNPLVVAVPRVDGPVVVDMAMSQYSFGRLEGLARRGHETEVPGGWDVHQRLTTDPAAVLATGRVVPTGFWKGSALSIVLDVLAVACSGGRATREIPADPEQETGVSQVFIAIDVQRSHAWDDTARRISTAIEELAAVAPLDPGAPVRYPGERVLQARRDNLELGVPVDDAIWAEVRDLAGRARG
jgi:3-dehydro-L-gulonate 2-dehydrogenase